MNGHTNGTNGVIGSRGRKGLVDIIASDTRCTWNRKIENTEMDKFRAVINKKYDLKLRNYWDLHAWSVKNYQKFWEEMWNYYGIIHSKPYTEIYSCVIQPRGLLAKAFYSCLMSFRKADSKQNKGAKNGKGFIDIDWFSGARLNYAENILRYRNGDTAIICVDEEENEEYITYAELYEEVERYAAAFRKSGLQMGDRVACYMCNVKEAVYAYLAALSIGALWGGPLPFYGDKAASKIIRPMLPKFLFTVDRFLDLKKEKNLMQNIPTIVKDLDCLEKIVIVPSKKETLSIDIKQLDPRCIFLEDFLKVGRNPDGSVPTLTFEQLPANYPICINFTSGTTGQPKGLVHSCSSLLPLFRDFNLHYNLVKGDVVLTPYPVGWNLWNLFIANIALGVTILLYNGCPFYPEAGFWEVIDKYKVAYTFLATSVVDKMEKNDVVPGPDCKLEHLKMLTVGASPVKLQNFDFLLNRVKSDMFVNCLYGATEVIGVFSGFDWNTPVYSAEIQAPALGVDWKCFDAEGNSVIGQKGELVICTPNPSFPVGVWNDVKGRKLEELYLTKYPGVWCQNDECWIDPNTRGMVIIGRSDDVLNPNGERFGAADIYYAIHTMEELQDYICIGQDNLDGDQRVVLFVKMKNGFKYNEEFAKKVQKQVETQLTEEHVPALVLEVQDIPYNLNGKKMERLLKTIIQTNEIPETNNIKNPECLKAYVNIPELQGY
ncbi:acetoacetyl-CoA synthetase-like isoform X1 [Argiope bruennichi]|uniref:acetoacetyl-CoA synthetase-like isoform X1 n=1 Tax=Argiope bruennichi TaxID=94029 RepID=UPI00249445A9|nr:acetoacetyl-CoA synthetase-like isoform X1 [Argiope bruennichi]